MPATLVDETSRPIRGILPPSHTTAALVSLVGLGTRYPAKLMLCLRPSKEYRPQRYQSDRTVPWRLRKPVTCRRAGAISSRFSGCHLFPRQHVQSAQIILDSLDADGQLRVATERELPSHCGSHCVYPAGEHPIQHIRNRF